MGELASRIGGDGVALAAELALWARARARLVAAGHGATGAPEPLLDLARRGVAQRVVGLRQEGVLDRNVGQGLTVFIEGLDGELDDVAREWELAEVAVRGVERDLQADAVQVVEDATGKVLRAGGAAVFRL